MRNMFTDLKRKVAVIGAVAMLGAALATPGAVYADSVKVASIDTSKITGTSVHERLGPRSEGQESVNVASKLTIESDSDTGFPVLGSHVPYPESMASLSYKIGPRDGATGSFGQALVASYGNFPVLGSHVPYPDSQVSITEQLGPRATDLVAFSLAENSSTFLTEMRGPYSQATTEVSGGNLPIRGAHVPLNR